MCFQEKKQRVWYYCYQNIPLAIGLSHHYAGSRKINSVQVIFIFLQRDRDRQDRIDDRAGEKWLSDTPTNTIILRGLPDCIEEKDVCLHFFFNF